MVDRFKPGILIWLREWVWIRVTKFNWTLDQSSLSHRLIESVLDNVLLEHGGLPHVLPLAVHLIFYLNR